MKRRDVVAWALAAPIYAPWPGAANAQAKVKAPPQPQTETAAPQTPAPLAGAAPAPAPPPGSPAGAPGASITPVPLSFPRDFGSHPQHQTEWWYLTGWLEAKSAGGGGAPRLFGFQVTFFRSRTGFTAAGSRFSPDQLVFAHAALSDLQAGVQRHDQRIARAGFGVRVSESDTDVALEGWALQRSGDPDRANYRARVRSDSAKFAFDLTLHTDQPTLLQGEAGYSRKGVSAAQASHYYSHPQLALQGTLDLDGTPMQVTGLAWMDHEWSDSVLASDAVGWDWTGMNLDDGSALTAFQLRRRDGTASFAGGSFRKPGEPTRNFAADEVRFTPGRRWKSPASNASYPVEWTVITPAGTFDIAALLDAQELDSRASTGAFYWEGLSELRAHSDAATSPKRLGRGYLEMTGYVQRLTL